MRLDDDMKYFAEPEFKKLLAQYEAAHEEGMPLYMDAEDLTDIAEYYAMVAKDEASSNEAIDLALQLHPDAVDPQIFRARQFMLKGDVEKARELCDAIEDQQHREVYFLRAELLVCEEKGEEAFNMLVRLIDTIDEDRDYFIYDAAYIFVDYQMFNWAFDLAYKLEEMAPVWYKTWQLMADVLLGMGQNVQALEYLEEMLDVDPFDVESWNWRAEAYSAIGTYDKAYESTEYALAIDPKNERALQLKAWVMMQQGNCAAAHELYVYLEKMNPECELHWLYDSYCMLDADKPQQALELIEHAIELAGGESSEQQMIYEQYAQTLSRLGDVQGALQQLENAEKLKENKEQWDERMLAARVYAENNDLKGMLIEAEKQMKAYPDWEEQIYYQTAVIAFDYAYYQRAYSMFEELLQRNQGVIDEALDWDIYGMMAYIDMDMGHQEAALKYLRKAIDAQEPHLSELFAEKFPGVRAYELYDYYYNKVYGRWPNG